MDRQHHCDLCKRTAEIKRTRDGHACSPYPTLVSYEFTLKDGTKLYLCGDCHRARLRDISPAVRAMLKDGSLLLVEPGPWNGFTPFSPEQLDAAYDPRRA